MNRSVLSIAALLLAAPGDAGSTPVTGWVTTNGDAAFAGGSEATNSPVTTDADADTIVGSFPEVTLAVGQSIQLTGSVVISGRTGIIPGNQFRWGFFDAPGTPTNGVGDGYVGVWAAANNGPADIRSADGSTGNPFSSSATTVISTASDPDGGTTRFDQTLTFSLTITRADENQITTTATLENGTDFSVEWPETNSSASPGNFTYDSVGILLGGTTDATSATFADIEVAGVETEPIAITGVSREPVSGNVTLTWTSEPGRFYAIDSSTDLASWPGDVDDSVPGAEDADVTSFLIDADALGLGEQSFFRVREIAP